MTPFDIYIQISPKKEAIPMHSSFPKSHPLMAASLWMHGCEYMITQLILSRTTKMDTGFKVKGLELKATETPSKIRHIAARIELNQLYGSSVIAARIELSKLYGSSVWHVRNTTSSIPESKSSDSAQAKASENNNTSNPDWVDKVDIWFLLSRMRKKATWSKPESESSDSC